MDNTPASKAGVESGDVVIEFNGKKVEDLQSFRMQVASTAVGKKVTMKVLRDGKEKTLKVKIGEYPDQLSDVGVENDKKSKLGLRVINLTDAQAQRFNLDVTTGVAVIDVKPGTPAADAGLSTGDVILAIGKTSITNVSIYEKAVAKLKTGKPVIFHIQRKERKLYIAVTP
jgi:serine protease Do